MLKHCIGITALLIVCCFMQARAQERIPNNEIPDINPYPENLIDDKLNNNYDAERVGTSQEKQTQNKEQLITAPKLNKPKQTETVKPAQGKNGDDALSFNFLYYIIQKFKISDIVEQ
jgi:hypothetical protein